MGALDVDLDHVRAELDRTAYGGQGVLGCLTAGAAVGDGRDAVAAPVRGCRGAAELEPHPVLPGVAYSFTLEGPGGQQVAARCRAADRSQTAWSELRQSAFPRTRILSSETTTVASTATSRIRSQVSVPMGAVPNRVFMNGR